jgi:YVTN family beta-propeller protein
MAYAPWDSSFYVAAPPSSLDVILASNESITAIIPVGTGPFGVAVDPSLKEVFVTNGGSANVTVINGTAQKPTSSVHVGKDPKGIAFDATNGTLYVANNGSNNLSVISVSSLSIVRTINVGTEPAGVAWDNATNRIFVTDRGSDQVTVISGTTFKVLANISVGSQPFGIADDNATGNLYAANEGSNNVSVISAKNENAVANVPVVAEGFQPDLQGVAYDSIHQVVWVTAGATVIVINTTIERTVDELGYDPAGIAYDPSNGEICVSNSANVTFGCFSFAWATSRMANVTFSETGLPAGTKWNVTFPSSTTNTTQTATNSTMVWGVEACKYQCYNYSYSVGGPSGYVANPAKGTVNSSTGADSAVSIAFTSKGVYLVTFAESGLAWGTNWSVTLGGSTQFATMSSVHFAEKNGTYTYSISAVHGYATTPTNSSVTVAGAAVSTAVSWKTLPTYFVTFSESGLPTGTIWRVTLGGAPQSTTSSSIGFKELNGTYAYTTTAGPSYWANPDHGNVTVAGTAVSVNLTWAAAGTYAVSFGESGLPTGARWNAELNNSSSGWGGSEFAPSGFVFDVPDGPYNYSVSGPAGWEPVPAFGSLTVNGSPASISVVWTQVALYPVTFSETGLPNATLWNVTLPGSATTYVSQGSSTALITFSEPNGTYSFSAYMSSRTPNGTVAYGANPSSGVVMVSGSAVTVRIVFSLRPSYFLVTFAETGLPNGSNWSLALGGNGYSATGSTLTAPLPNGTFPYSVGSSAAFTASPSSGSVTVRGAPLRVSISFTISPGYYLVTFVETGLGPATGWSVTLGGAAQGSSATTIGFAEPNGTYGYAVDKVTGYSVAPTSGNVSVAGAAPAPIEVRFNSTSVYEVEFRETGLPKGTGWAVSIGSQLESSLTANVALIEPNGTYGYLILPVAGYVTTDSGFVTVDGGNLTVAVTFDPQSYPVIVVEFGLPSGTNWSVTVSNATTGVNVTHTTTGNAVIFYLPNGTYSISVKAPGYSASLTSPTFTVAGVVLGGSPTVHFAPSAASVGASLLWQTAALWGGAVAAGVVALVGGLTLLRRRAARNEGNRWVEELTSDSATSQGSTRR